MDNTLASKGWLVKVAMPDERGGLPQEQYWVCRTWLPPTPRPISRNGATCREHEDQGLGEPGCRDRFPLERAIQKRKMPRENHPATSLAAGRLAAAR
jgi:hypothetical protein